MALKKTGGLRLRRRLVQGWRLIRTGRSTGYSLIEPASDRFSEKTSGSTPGMGWARSLKRYFNKAEAVEEEKRPPKGHLVVYVGGGGGGGEKGEVGSTPRRYVVPVVYFNHPLFGELLREVEEEFGFGQPGGITIPCSVRRFERVKDRIAGDSSG